MTQETQNQIINQFWGIVPTIVIFILVAAILGIGFKLLSKKLQEKLNKNKNEFDKKSRDK